MVVLLIAGLPVALREKAVVVVLREMNSEVAARQPGAPTLVVAAFVPFSALAFGAGSAQALLGRSALP